MVVPAMNAKKWFKNFDLDLSSVGGCIVALGFLVGMVAVPTAQQAVPELVVGLSGPMPMAFDQVYEAEAAGIVSATLNYNGNQRGAVCGYVGSDRQTLHPNNRATSAVMLAVASIQCRNNGGCGPDAGVYIPASSMSMPVSEGQFWTITDCGGAGDSRVYFHSLTIETR